MPASESRITERRGRYSITAVLLLRAHVVVVVVVFYQTTKGIMILEFAILHGNDNVVISKDSCSIYFVAFVLFCFAGPF